MKKDLKNKMKRFKSLIVFAVMVIMMVSCSQTMTMSGSADENTQAAAAGITESTAVTVNKPFPQHVTYTGPEFTKPSYTQSKLDSDVITYFTKWKNTYIKPFRIVNGFHDANLDAYIIFADSNGTIEEWKNTQIRPTSQSEATGYAMITFVLMAGHDPQAKEIFDGLYSVYRNFPCKYNDVLMSWAVPGPILENGFDKNTDFRANPGDFSAPRLAPATDGDMDVAYALLQAHKQWGSTGRFNYLEEAKKIIAAMEEHSIFKTGPNRYYPRLNTGDRDTVKKKYEQFKATRGSDWMLTHTEAFYTVTKHKIWSDLDSATARMMRDGSDPVTGLVADFYGDIDGVFQTFEGVSDESGGIYDNDYYYNSARVSWRAAMAYAHHGTYIPQMVNKRITAWLVGKFTQNGVFRDQDITAGYSLDGTQLRPGGHQWASDTFNAPFMCGMAVSGPEYQQQLTQLWDNTMGFEGIGTYNKYFDDSLSLLSLLFVSGNWWKPTTRADMPETPLQVKNVVEYSVADTQIEIDWDSNIDYFVEYLVYRKEGANGAFSRIATLVSPVAGYRPKSFLKDTGLKPNTTYTYYVTAAILSKNLESPASNMVTITTTGSAAGPAAWQDGVYYEVGDKVTYGGKTWICDAAHSSNAAWYPGAPGLWFWRSL